MKTSKRVLSLVLMLLLITSIAVPAFALSSSITPEKTTIAYMNYKKVTNYSSKLVQFIPLASGTKNFTIKRSTVKLTDPGKTGAVLTQFYKSQSNTDDYDYDNGTYSSSSKSCRYTVDLRVNGTGTAKIAYKIGTESFTKKVKILAYTNPVASITLTGVNGGKNFKSVTDKQAFSGYNENVQVTKKVSNAKLTVKAATGWKITNVTFYDHTVEYNVGSHGYNSTVTSRTLRCGALNPTHYYEVTMNLENLSNGAEMRMTYYIPGVNSK